MALGLMLDTLTCLVCTYQISCQNGVVWPYLTIYKIIMPCYQTSKLYTFCNWEFLFFAIDLIWRSKMVLRKANTFILDVNQVLEYFN